MQNGDWQSIVPLAIFVVILAGMFWWIVLRPTTRLQRKHRELIGSLQKGDNIVTVGGIYGTITQVREDDIDIEVAQGLILTFDRRAVRRRRE